ncbi:MAG: zinc metalloprotease HtpX [Bacteroidetes bacterium]|jgi:heat shock protein HtpX|nr:zinc metalloprotease HtpX [Bacteroidota bacterium]
MNTLKTTLLMTVLTVLFVMVGNWLGGQSGMMMAFAFAILMNVGTYWFSDKMVLRMYGAEELDRSQYGHIYRMTEELTHRAGIPMPRLYLIRGDQPNAFATGRNPQNAAVAVTESIVRLLTKDELRGVVAHELAHIKNRDILVATIAATFAGAISMIANMAQWAMIFGGRSNDEEGGGNPIVAIVMMIVAPLAAMMIQMAISRQREFLADAGGAQMSGNPISLANALKRLHSASQQVPMQATPATAHLFIVNPFSGGAMMKLFSTHPPMEERVARLEEMAYGRSISVR